MLQPSNKSDVRQGKTFGKPLGSPAFRFYIVTCGGVGSADGQRRGGRYSGGMRTIGSAGKLEIHPCVAVDFFSGFDVELADGDLAGMLVPDGDAVAAEEVIVDLLGGAAVFEDQGDRALGGRSGRETGRLRLVIGTRLGLAKG